MFKLIKNALVYAPDFIGKRDILVAYDRIAKIDETIDAVPPSGTEIIEAQGKLLVPGFIDPHVHIAGGGGEGGFSTRTPEINVADLLENGITTVVGVLGTDGVTRSLEGLYAKARSLEAQGVTAYIYSGSYQIPVLTFTGSIQKDLVLIDKVLGVGEIALADHRAFCPTADELARIAAEARNGGMLAGKTGIVHLHMGDGKEGLSQMLKVIEGTCIPNTQFFPTHVNRNPVLLAQAAEFAKTGGTIDLTAGFEPDEYYADCIPAYHALESLLGGGVPLSNITMSSDGNGSIPEYDACGKLAGVLAASCRVLAEDVRKAVMDCHIPFETVLKTVTQNPARVLGIQECKGEIAEGKHADLIIMDEWLDIQMVLAKGVKVVENGKYLLQG